MTSLYFCLIWGSFEEIMDNKKQEENKKEILLMEPFSL